MAYSRKFNFTKIIVLLLALLCLSAFPVYSANLGSELITNTGFESGSTGWSLGANTARDTSTGHTGSASIRLNAAKTPASVYFSGLSCFAGRKVNISAWAKTVGTDEAQGGAVIEIKCLNSANRVIGSQRTYPTATGGAWKQIQLVAMVPLNAASMRLTLINTSNFGNAWFDDISCLFANAVSFRTMIRQPEYRQTIFSGDPLRVVIGAEVYDSTINPAASLAIRSDLIKPDGTVVSSSLLKTVVNKSWQNLGISIPPGITGELIVRNRLLARASGSVLRESTDKVLVGSNTKPSVYFDDQNRCIVNGNPFFPICIVGDKLATADLDRLQAAGVNSVLDSGMLARTLAEQKSFLDALHSRNMKSIYSLSDCYSPLHEEATITSWGNWIGVSNVISGLVNANKNHPALLAWYINNQRSGDYQDQIRNTYNSIVARDPEHPCFQSLEGMQDYGSHTGTSDVSGLASFPVWQRYADSASSAYMPMFGSQTRVAFKSGMYSRPVWMLAETAKFAQPTNSVAPTAQQILCEAYQAIINGARGVVLSNLTNVKTDGDTQYQALETVAQNLKAIAPIALGQDVPQDQRVTSSNPAIECTTRRVGEDVYILAVNTGASTVTASFTVPEKLASVEGHAVDSGLPGAATKLILLSGNTLSDNIANNGTKVYKLRKYSLDKLMDSPKPNFKKGHTLPRLSYWLGGPLPFDTMKELTENWGYTLGLTIEDSTINALNNPDSSASKLCALAASDPDRYPLHLIPYHYWMTWGNYNLLSNVPETAWCHTDSPGTARTRTRTRWSASADVPVGTLRQCADLPEEVHARVYKCIQSAGSKDNRPVPDGNAWWVLATDAELDASPGTKIWSPEAPTSIFEDAGSTWAAPIVTLKQRYPTIKTPIIINGAEYGLGVLGWNRVAWAHDPAVWNALGTWDNTTYWNYISSQKLRQETPIASAFRVATPDRELYINYGCSAAGVRQKNNPGWTSWGYDYAKMRTTTDVPSTETYYQYEPTWTATWDWLSRVTNQAAQQIPLGDPLSYDFLSAGWRSAKNTLASSMDTDDMKLTGVSAWATQMPQPGKLQIDGEVVEYSSIDMETNIVNLSARGVDGTSAAAHAKSAKIYKLPEFYVADPEPYTGFLKMRYALGSIGHCLFYGIPEENDPHWRWQFEQSAHLHALYSHLEDYLRNGDLLPGPGMHRWSFDLPAYEFPTGSAWTRVVVRKKKNSNDWLIAAWAQDGVEKTVSVTIPTLGEVTVNARVAGSVYTATLSGSSPVLTLVDTDAMNPSAGFSTD